MKRARKNDRRREPVVAPGMRDFLEEPATPEEVRRGDFTRVTRLSWDETRPR